MRLSASVGGERARQRMDAVCAAKRNVSEKVRALEVDAVLSVPLVVFSGVVGWTSASNGISAHTP